MLTLGLSSTWFWAPQGADFCIQVYLKNFFRLVDRHPLVQVSHIGDGHQHPMDFHSGTDDQKAYVLTLDVFPLPSGLKGKTVAEETGAIIVLTRGDVSAEHPDIVKKLKEALVCEQTWLENPLSSMIFPATNLHCRSIEWRDFLAMFEYLLG